MPEAKSPEKPDKSTLIPLRLSWPKTTAVESLCEQRKAEMARACELLRQRIPNCRCAKVDELSTEVAVTLANRYLTTFVKKAEPAQEAKGQQAARVKRDAEPDSDRLPADMPAFSNEKWLCDLFLATSCNQQDAAANEELMKVIDSALPRTLAAKDFSDHVIREVVDDMPSHVKDIVKQGFNRGRPRLAHFSGSSTLKTWLQVTAVNRAIDLAEKIADRNEISLSDDTDAGKDSESKSSELLNELRSALRTAIGELMLELARDKAVQPDSKQLDFIVRRFVQDKSPSEVAKLFGVGENRINEIAEIIRKKLVNLLIKANPRWEGFKAQDAGTAEGAERKAINDRNRQIRHWLEEWLTQMFDFSDLGAVAIARGDV